MTPESVRQQPLIWLLILSVAVLLGGCVDRQPPSGGIQPAESPSVTSIEVDDNERFAREDLPAITDQMREDAASLVMGACSRCHAPLPADTLPRAAWEKVVLSMADMVGDWGQPAATAEELAIALHWYEQQAPLKLEYSRHLPEQQLQFETISLTPRGLESERIPAVSDLIRWERTDGQGAAILVSELRSRRLMVLPLGDLKSARLMPFLPGVDFRYPAALSSCEIDGSGDPEVLVASIGGMNPGNEVRGGAWLATSDKGRWSARRVGEKLARVCDLKGSDLDGDGDVDLVACAFGFRGPGRLVLLRAEGETFETTELDARDGFVAVVIEDVDGDGDDDLIALLSQQHEVLMQFTNDGSGNFSPEVLMNWPHAAWGSSGLEAVDLDGDGDQDLVVVNGDTLDDNTPKPIHGVRWLERVGSSFPTLHEILLLPGCERAAVGDLDGDGDLDVVGAAFMPQVDPATWNQWDSLVWAENLGGAKEWQVRTLEVGNPVHSAVLLDDVDEDGVVDIILGNYVWLRSDGTPTRRSDYLTVLRGIR